MTKDYRIRSAKIEYEDRMTQTKELVAINGHISKPEDAKISVFDRGFLFGDAIYEVTRSYGRILFELEAHVDRLFKSAEQIDMRLQMNKAELIGHIYSIYKKLDIDNVFMRIQISRGQGPIGMSGKIPQSVNEVIYMYPFVPIDSSYYTKGAKAFVTSRLRNSKRALDPNIKSGNYLNNVMAFIEGEKQDAFESFMVNDKNHITEGCTSNIFMVKNGVFITPPSDYDILQGITRKIIMKIAPRIGAKVTEEGFDLKTLQNADEVFLTSSTREIVPINNVNGRSWDVSRFSLTKKLTEAYKRYIEEYCESAQKTHPWK